jgi:hypothetical protein
MSMFDEGDDDVGADADFDDEGGFFGTVDEPVCRGCGCSYTRPCPGGCVWATVDLCSACVRGRS